MELFGSKGREYATGRGVVLATREALRLLGLGPLKNKRCVVQVISPQVSHPNAGTLSPFGM